MARQVTLAANAVVTDAEAQRFVFKDHGATAHTDDELDILAFIVNAVSVAIENHILGPVVEQTYTEKFDGGEDTIFPARGPIISVTTLKDNGTALVKDTDFYVEKWYIELDDDYGTFTAGQRTVELTYKAGLASPGAGGQPPAVNNVPQAIKLAACLWILDTWNTGPANLARTVTDHGIITPTKMPPQVAGLLKPYRRPWVGSV